ncbi:MAG: histidinol dehydrogenase, partial [Verrucomicrobia bacterium]|nr:histidinol dehydrogenase [Verrucomicrobiota bacterium]
MEIKIARWSTESSCSEVDRFLNRPAIDPAAEETARRVLEDIRRQGDPAVARYVREFDGAALKPGGFAVSPGERKTALDQVDDEFKRCATDACRRITRFARAGLRKDWTLATPKGGVLGEQFVPLGRVGAYIPAGAAPLASTALMTVTLARVADVREIVACSPAGADGLLDPHLLYCLDLAGATEIYKIGGIQAIGAMAYGTASIRKVQKIVG